MAKESRRFSVWLPAPALRLLQERAEVSKLSVATELREALLRGLKSESALPELAEINKRLDQLEVITLAGLIATEHLIRFTGKHYPEGERRLLAVSEEAYEKAEDRLMDVTDRLAQEAAQGR